MKAEHSRAVTPIPAAPRAAVVPLGLRATGGPYRRGYEHRDNGDLQGEHCVCWVLAEHARLACAFLFFQRQSIVGLGLGQKQKKH